MKVLKLFVLLGVILIMGCGSKEETKNANQPESTQSAHNVNNVSAPQAAMIEARKTKLMQAGMAFLNQGDVEKAVAVFNEVIAMDPRDSRGYFILTETYMRLKNYEGAVDILNNLINQDPQNGQAYYLLGIASGLTGDRQLALDAARKSVLIFQGNRDEENFKRSLALLQSLTAEGKSGAVSDSIKMEDSSSLGE